MFMGLMEAIQYQVPQVLRYTTSAEVWARSPGEGPGVFPGALARWEGLKGRVAFSIRQSGCATVTVRRV